MLSKHGCGYCLFGWFENNHHSCIYCRSDIDSSKINIPRKNTTPKYQIVN